MFEGPVTGNIPEALDNGEVTDGTHVAAGQLALALTPYAQVTQAFTSTQERKGEVQRSPAPVQAQSRVVRHIQRVRSLPTLSNRPLH